MLSPIYIEFMTEVIGNTIARGHVQPLDLKDQTALMAMALYYNEHKADAEKIREGLQKFGLIVNACWLGYAEQVRKHNLEGVASAHAPVTDLIGRMKNGALG